MDNKIKEQWLADLRSGEYEQGQLLLCDSIQKHCCLGVLCRSMIKLDFDIVIRIDSGGDARFDDEPCELPNHLKEQAGLDSEQCEILMVMNDKEEADFNEIADFIEANF